MKFSIFPHGLSLGQGSFRPAMIFKDKKEHEVLPVWLDPVQANLLLAEAQSTPQYRSPHMASLKIFDALKVNLKSIYFDDVNGSMQMATITAEQEGKQVSVKVSAAEAMSLAVNAGVHFFTNTDVIEKSRSISFDMLLHMEPHPHDFEELH